MFHWFSLVMTVYNPVKLVPCLHSVTSLASFLLQGNYIDLLQEVLLYISRSYCSCSKKILFVKVMHRSR